MVEMENLDWTWHWPWGTTLVILALVYFYVRGWRNGRAAISEPLHPRLFMIGLTLLVLAWVWPLNSLSTQLLSARAVQRLLLIGLIPFMLLLSNSTLVLFHGLPQTVRNSLQTLPEQKPRLYQTVVSLTKPSFAWLFFVCCVWLWYDTQLHQLTLHYHWLHNIESLLLLAAALFYWWHILAVTPHLHKPMHPVIRILYALIGSGPIKIVGLILLFSTQRIYNYPASLQFQGLNISDQGLGGILIWTMGGIVFTWTAVYLMRLWISDEDDKPLLPHGFWASDEAMLAPGFRKPANNPPSRQ